MQAPLKVIGVSFENKKLNFLYIAILCCLRCKSMLNPLPKKPTVPDPVRTKPTPTCQVPDLKSLDLDQYPSQDSNARVSSFVYNLDSDAVILEAN